MMAGFCGLVRIMALNASHSRVLAGGFGSTGGACVGGGLGVPSVTSGAGVVPGVPPAGVTGVTGVPGVAGFAPLDVPVG